MALACALVGWGALSCGTSAGDLPDAVGDLKLLSVSPGLLVPGTRIVVTGQGFRAGATTLAVRGDVTGSSGTPRRLDHTLFAEVQDGTHVTAVVDTALFDAAGGDGDFVGQVVLEMERDGRPVKLGLTARFVLSRSISPALDHGTELVAWFGDTVTVEGDNFLLGGTEGDFVIDVSGTFTPDVGNPETIDAFPLDAHTATRETAEFVLGTELFGLRTGEFKGTLTPRNRHKDGPMVEGAAVSFGLLILPSAIGSVSPGTASRRQKVGLSGNGFYSSASDGVETTLRLEGRFTRAAGGSETVDAELPLRVESSTHAVWVIAPNVLDGELTGFGSQPGTFEGTMTPVLVKGTSELAGQPKRGSFTVSPTVQVVHVKFVPGFVEALRLFGLRNLDRQVRDRVFEVARRDYDGLRIQFVEEPPDDFEHWTTVELTGSDPNEADLFGLDNTEGKDEGNLRLNDYVGGTNAEQGAVGAFAYGGVFIESFMRFSPNICRQQRDDFSLYFAYCAGGSQFGLASPRFDDVFAPFAPLLKGTEARIDEWSTGARSEQVREAVRVLGNIAGNTLVHELGHSLGLAVVTGAEDRFHNAGDEPRMIMNPGGFRPFEERAELDEQGPATWAEGDREYLQSILGE